MGVLFSFPGSAWERTVFTAPPSSSPLPTYQILPPNELLRFQLAD